MAEPAVHELAQTEADLEIIWRAYELRPEPNPTLDPEGDYLKRVWNNSVYPLAEKLGVTMKLPPVQPRSRLAHQAAQWARREGRFEEFNAAIFRAFFERGENIGEIDVLTALAANLEMDSEALKRALDAKLYEPSVLADERAAEDLGVTGVPAFIANRKVALTGVQLASSLKQMARYAQFSPD